MCAEVVRFDRAEAAGDAALSARGLRLVRSGRTLLAGLDLDVAEGGVTALIGPNGAGKSVLLRCLAGLVRPDAGTVRLAPGIGAPGLVFQAPVVLRRSVAANLRHALRLARVPRRARAGRLAELLVTGRLTEHASQPATALSGGERQRLALVRALASAPRLLLLDEPSASLDPGATAELEDLVRRIAGSGVTVVLVTHDRAQAARLATEVAFVHRGRVVETAPAARFFAGPTSAAARAYLNGELLT